MTASQLLSSIRLVRRDLGDLLFHFTRQPDASTPTSPTGERPKNARAALWKILREQTLIGSSGYIKGGHKCICFTEAPITEVASLFRLSESAANSASRPRYEPYGLAVTKEWCFSKGGRPVIYQPETEYARLPKGIRYRHVTYDPSLGVDFAWEREWRLSGEELRLDPAQTLVVVPSSKDAFEIMYELAHWEADYDDDRPINAWPEPHWMAVSLDFFGLRGDGQQS